MDRGRLKTQVDQLIQDYTKRNTRSKALFDQAQSSLPGGNTRTGVYFSPFPIYLARGDGPIIHDVDGNALLDFMNNNTALILGHAHPAVVEAVRQQVSRGTGFNRPTELEIVMAELLCQRIASVETVRFCNSGTEALICAIRVAKGYTGKSKIAKFEGAYHGSGEYAQISHVPTLGPDLGPANRPASVPSSPGVTDAIINEVVVLPFNDSKSCEEIIQREADELAAVVIDPISTGAGFTLPLENFLTHLREITEDAGVLLIFDEVISLRIQSGGAQEYYGVRPDLTCMGKIIAGGLPGGAYGGRADVMALFDPLAKPRIAQAGTYNGNPLTMVAGIATLKEMSEERYLKIGKLARQLEAELNSIFLESSIDAVCTSIGSLFKIHFLKERPENYREATQDDSLMHQWLFFWLMAEGIHLSQGGSISTPMNDNHIDQLVDSVRRGLKQF